ncbi:hypothetical protein [Martelella sp. AD-3]|uniref:phage tail assembly chaperone n=1 Tax=Martelella sp. AD-3 TaxID=686597 RepID=UPI000463DA05|nr:hypothetical protein [Martelella sp. AD-3]AMM83153.1 hypothetical protein AZF01_01235 [Martelella sp. AD-3]
MSKLQERLCEVVKHSLSSKTALPLPEGGQLLWQWFCDLHGSRSWRANGPNPISYGEIAIYRQVSGWPMEECHVVALRAMDDVWLTAYYEQQKKPKRGELALPALSDRSMTTALFDAMFEVE